MRNNEERDIMEILNFVPGYVYKDTVGVDKRTVKKYEVYNESLCLLSKVEVEAVFMQCPVPIEHRVFVEKECIVDCEGSIIEQLESWAIGKALCTEDYMGRAQPLIGGNYEDFLDTEEYANVYLLSKYKIDCSVKLTIIVKGIQGVKDGKYNIDWDLDTCCFVDKAKEKKKMEVSNG